MTAYIYREVETGGYMGIYVHSDGEPEHVGRVLKTYYTDPDKVAALIDLGHISILGREIGEQMPWRERYENLEFDENGTIPECLVYHRDRGDSWNQNHPFHEPTIEAIIVQADTPHNFIDHHYLFKDGRWYYRRSGSGYYRDL